MKVKNSNMQAFPFIEPHEDDNIKAYHPGMTMRDEFAKAALQALIPLSNGDDGEILEAAEDAYSYADAMMKARK
jgi:hypothetical protein